VRALIHTAQDNHTTPSILVAVNTVNEKQKGYLFRKIKCHFSGDLKGKVFAVWGLSFKPGTDDTREAPSKVLIAQLKSAGATVVTYDPVVRGPESAEDQYSALKDADALVLVTEWKMFRHPDFALMRQLMKPNPVIFDGRNIYDKPEGFTYYGVGR
jgi:UDPglucose 6-dehydrogenase